MRVAMLTGLALALSPILAVTSADAQTVRLMSYNVRVDVPIDNPRWAERRDPMAKQIAFVAPDIFGVQEAAVQAVDDLASRLPDYDHYGLGRDDGKVGESTTLFYNRARFKLVKAETQWCSSTPDTPGKDADAAFPRTITRLILRDSQSGRLLDVRNAHFDHRGVVARENCARQIEAIARWPRAVVLVMGDFNSPVDSVPYRLLSDDAGLNLKDARIGAEIDFGPTSTINGFNISRPDGGGAEAIDHIFVDRALKVTRFAVLTDSIAGRAISDHYPIVADVVVTKK